jgi:hypothetical protein
VFTIVHQTISIFHHFKSGVNTNNTRKCYNLVETKANNPITTNINSKEETFMDWQIISLIQKQFVYWVKKVEKKEQWEAVAECACGARIVESSRFKKEARRNRTRSICQHLKVCPDIINNGTPLFVEKDLKEYLEFVGIAGN